MGNKMLRDELLTPGEDDRFRAELLVSSHDGFWSFLLHLPSLDKVAFILLALPTALALDWLLTLQSVCSGIPWHVLDVSCVTADS